MFDEICSIYESSTDNKGRFVDRETGECTQQMTIREFCLTDRWKPYVQRLRAMRQELGSKAKKMPEYIETKKMLPGATLSGLFELWEDDCIDKNGRTYRDVVSRRETHLKQHTGWLAIDIDLDDNQQITCFDNIRKVCRFRPEVALLMRSCSGTGYFGLVRLAYPEQHKAQFKALRQEYAALGITLDKACSNIGRVRFASWDDPEHIYINEKAIPYKGLDAGETQILLTDTSHRHQPGRFSKGPDSCDIIYLKASRLVSKIEACGVDIMGCYDEWVRCGMALHDVSALYGYDMWKRVSRFRPAEASHGHKDSDFSSRWAGFANSRVRAETFFWMCKNSNIELTDDDLIEIYQTQ